jgi:hypothetical protein
MTHATITTDQIQQALSSHLIHTYEPPALCVMGDLVTTTTLPTYVTSGWHQRMNNSFVHYHLISPSSFRRYLTIYLRVQCNDTLIFSFDF